MADRIQVVEAVCVASDGGTVTLSIHGDQAGDIGSGPTLMTHQYLSGRERHVEVKSCSVDGLCRELELRPAAVKVDVEGAELQVVLGATLTLTECRPAVWLAFHPYAFPDPRAATEELFAVFRSAGYALPSVGPDAALAFGEYEFKPA